MAIHECFPYLRVSDGDAAVRWYCDVFGGRERFRLVDPADGRVGHAEVELAEGIVIMVSAAYPEMGILAPTGNTGCGIHLHVDDADAVVARAVDAGATVVRPVRDQFYGERSGAFRDPFGHEWLVGHDIESVEPEEMQRRWNAM
ncbi:MAG: VOC family protein [Alphaproteobacteria bacterium]|nr:VOC family protein [Alphaproteobacteria bacterium]